MFNSTDFEGFGDDGSMIQLGIFRSSFHGFAISGRIITLYLFKFQFL